MQHYDLAKVTQIVNVAAIVILYDEIVNHLCQHGLVYAHEEYGKVSYEICRHHHERYDGRGYPDGLKGEQIPLSAQIVSIADVYDALVNERVYKSAFSKEKAFQMIVTGECGVFSPKLLDCFWNARRAFERLADG